MSDNLSAPVELPSGRIIVFREATNSDRRILQDGFGGEELSKPGRMEEALAYTCLVKDGDKDLKGMSWQNKADLFSYKDGQFYEQLFVQASTINKDEYGKAERLAKSLLETGMKPVELLSGKKIVFREPRNSDRRTLLEGFEGEELSKRGRLEEALAYQCLEKLDKQDLSNLSWSKRSDMLTLKDGQFFQALFLEMFFLGKPEMQQVQQLSKKLFGSSIAVSST
jgi:hypothetical protein